MVTEFSRELVAPCGINCGACKAYLAYSRGVPRERGKVTHCSGCRERKKNCAFLKRDCEKLRKEKIEFCFECPDMPCAKLERLDESYRRRFNRGPVDDLLEMRANGVNAFIAAQRKRLMCPECGDVLSIHDGKCYRCLASRPR